MARKKNVSNITEKERYTIELCLKKKMKVDDIAELLGRARSTIYKEIAKGKTEQLNSDLTKKVVYLADHAQMKTDDAAKRKGRNKLLDNDIEFVEHIEKMTNEYKYSPYAIIEDIKNRGIEFKTKISLSTLKNYINAGVFKNIKKKAKKESKNERTVALHNLDARSIEERPKDVNKRESYGHWEMDTVVSGRKGKACLLVLTERCLREEIIIKINDKKANSVVKALDRLEKKYGAKGFRNKFKSITMDNGVEFMDNTGIEKSCINKKKPRTTTFYCHPFASSERGSNENANRLIRKWIPKGSIIDNITDEDIKKIESWMNNLPRKIFDGKSVNMMKKEIAV